MKKEKNEIKNISNVKEQENILSESEAIYKKEAFTKFSSFEEAIQHVNYINLENIKVPVIHYNDLVSSKLTSNRLKDKADIEELEKINKYRKE